MSDTHLPLPEDRERERDSTAEMLEEVVDSGFSLSDERIADIKEALYADDAQTLKTIFEDLSESDIADLLHKIDHEDRRDFFEKYADLITPEVYSYIDSDLRADMLSDMPSSAIARIISELDSDDALDIIEDLEPEQQKAILKKLSAKDRIALEEGLNYPEDSAGRLMQREYVAIPQFWTVGKTIDYLRAAADELPEEFYDLIVIDPSYHVDGAIPLNRIVRAKRSEKIKDLALEDLYVIPATMDQEEVAHLFRREDLGSAPVVDEDGRLIGVITIDDVIDVIDEEAEEDLLNLAGVGSSDLYMSAVSTSWRRIRWLAITMFNTIIAAFVISRFEATIEEIVALAILMPIVAAMGGNAGMQVVTVTVRALATRELSSQNYRRVIGKEMVVGIINGTVFGFLMGALAALWFGNPMLGIILTSAMLFNMFWASVAGTLIPILLDKFGFDPALAAGPFLTTTTDVLGFLAFLGLATLFLL
ncbi:MAG: magnesium transporter [Micavibrio sp.]